MWTQHIIVRKRVSDEEVIKKNQDAKQIMKQYFFSSVCFRNVRNVGYHFSLSGVKARGWP